VAPYALQGAPVDSLMSISEDGDVSGDEQEGGATAVGVPGVLCYVKAFASAEGAENGNTLSVDIGDVIAVTEGDTDGSGAALHPLALRVPWFKRTVAVASVLAAPGSCLQLAQTVHGGAGWLKGYKMHTNSGAAPMDSPTGWFSKHHVRQVCAVHLTAHRCSAEQRRCALP
jgi:hypothetical protein